MTVTRTHNLDGFLDVLQDAVFVSLEHGGLILKQEMQRLAPIWTAQMERSVTVGEPFVTPEGYFAIRVGPTVSYAKYTELEPYIIGKRPGPKSQIKGASIPWMKPAADNVRGEVLEAVRKGVGNAVRAMSRGFR